jgi:hypothetical protein
MTEYALAPTSNWDPTTSPYRSPRVMLEQNLLQAYRVRSNGTMRHLALLPLASTARETAEWISDAIEMDGRSVRSVGDELHISGPTVRRFLEALELTEEVEAGEWDDLTFDNNGQPVWATGSTEEDLVEDILDQLAGVGKPADEVLADLESAKAKQAAATPVRRSRGRKCTVCAKPVNTRNSAAKLRGAMGYEDMCAECYDEAGWENTHSDNGHGPANRDEECPVCKAEQAQAAKDEAILARNRASFTNTPAPTEEERAAALAGVTPAPATAAQTAPAAPTGLAKTVAAAPRRSAAGRTLAVCFCGGMGQHAPGAPGCANPAVPLRARSH